VLFDLGGVITDIDRDAFVGAAMKAGVDPRPALSFWHNGYEDGTDEDHPMHRAERGEILLEEFLRLADEAAPGASFLFDPASPGYIVRFVTPSVVWADIAVEARHHGIRIGALTNTMDGLSETDALRVDPKMHAHVRGLFGDDILESHVLGARKPSRAAFTAATTYFNVEPARVLFIDDELGNCKGAEDLGITAVHNDGTAGPPALARELLSL
jgi:FMN phosphatase YigB (HAD superfamily)